MPSCAYVFRPIVNWPGARRTSFKNSPFKASHSKTMDDMDREVFHLGARDWVLQVDCREEDIRIDGQLRKDVKPRSSAIIVSFTGRHGPVSFPCDTYSHWRDNLRAVALALQALRAVDRYGVTRNAEQYKGWRALPAGGTEMARAGLAAGEWATVEEAARYLCQVAWPHTTPGHDPVVRQVARGDKEILSGLYREAARKAHPAAGGTEAELSKINRCRDYIRSVVGTPGGNG